MCGISGLYHFNNSKLVDEATLTTMRDTLVHRGPDGGTNYLSKNKKVGISQRRLAIIDLSKEAACPMTNNNALWITYNGEVYNFKTLREELIKLGYKFKTNGDTEVILLGYEEWGSEIVKRLNGMFAFVIWDEKKQEIFAARDHLGIKPFFYTIQNGSFVFGSEIKAILAYPELRRELDENGLSHYLTFGSSPAPHTLFKDIKKLPAAHTLLIRSDKEIKIEEYWTPIVKSSEREAKSEEKYAEEIKSFLRDSIQKQMVSDVPFGCFLSGGIDSSTNAALMSEALGRPVETFSMGYKNFKDKNEFDHSRGIAKILGTHPHEILLDESHMREFLPQYGNYMDDPISDQAAFPLFWLSKLTKNSGVTVVQVGEGSDEIFAGYDQYLKILNIHKNFYNLLKHTPDLFKRLIGGKGKEYLERIDYDQKLFWGLAIAFSNHGKSELLSNNFQLTHQNNSYSIIENLYKEIEKNDPGADLLKQMTYLEIKHRLPEFLLARGDKMTMAHSVEARVPFLDHHLVELALNMPTDIKIKGGVSKYILKKAVKGVIPDEIINRKKQGFGNPISEWLLPKYDISKDLINTIFSSRLRKRNILNYERINKLVSDHQNKKADHGFKIWTLITLSLWHDYWF